MKTFEELPLKAPIRQAIKELGFETPSPIQGQTLPILLGAPTDFIGLAATGTGKTAAFGIPLLEQTDVSKKVPQVLVLCPTRELALQVSGQINQLGKYLKLFALPVYGGSAYGEQMRGLRSGAQIVVGTPGRVIDHIERGTLKLENIKTIVLDEADEMISMGFKKELERVLQTVDRETAHIWLFSATMNREIVRVANTYLRKPQKAQVNQEQMLSNTVEQLYYTARESDKPDILCKVIESAEDFYGLVFCQTKSLVADLTTLLTERGYKVDCLHGDKSQQERERTMQAFRSKKVRMLICTDVASRGLDVKDVTYVINYSIPRELENYVHRIGRTARSGKTGTAVSLVSPNQRYLVGKLEKMTKTRIKEAQIPSTQELAARKLSKILTKFLDQKAHPRAATLLGENWKSILAKIPRDEIASRFLTLLCPEVFEERTRTKAVLGPYATIPKPQDRSARRPERRFQPRRRGKSGVSFRGSRSGAGKKGAERGRPVKPRSGPRKDKPSASAH